MSPSQSPSDRRFEAELEIAAPRDAVWEAIATPDGLRRWFAPEASVEGRAGGEVVWSWGETHRWPQRVEVWEPGTRLRTRYDAPVSDAAGNPRPLFVDFQLEGQGGRTRLRLVHSGFGPEAAFDEEYDGIRRGWGVELLSLRLYLERHAGADRQLAWSTAPIQVGPDEAWERLTGDNGFRCGTAVDRLTEGAAFAMRSASGDLYEGRALHCQPREFCGVAESHGGGFLRFSVESCGGTPMVWLWLATYGEPAGRAGEQQQRWDEMLAALFSEPVASSAPSAARGGK